MAYIPTSGIDLKSVLSSVASGGLNYLSSFGVSIFDIPKVAAESRLSPNATKTKSSHTLMVTTLQKGLAAAGYAVMPTGKIDAATMAVAVQLAGSGWQSKPWAALYGLVMAKMKVNSTLAPKEDSSVIEQVTETVKANPLPLLAIAGGAVGLFLFMRSK